MSFGDPQSSPNQEKKTIKSPIATHPTTRKRRVYDPQQQSIV